MLPLIGLAFLLIPALLGSALTTALGIGVLIASPLVAIPAVRHHGRNHDCVLADSLHPGGPTRDDDLGRVPNVRLRSNLRQMAASLDQEIDAVYQRQEKDTGATD